MKNPKISVIIAVYKAQEYIERCARYLFEQTIDEIEYIFIDDCSPDNSMPILAEVINNYPARKSQVKIIRHNINQGVSQSRQDGVDLATGEYIIHCDPDDWIEHNAMEEMYSKAVEIGCDILFVDFIIESSTKRIVIDQHLKSNSPRLVIRQFFHELHGSLWNKLIRNKFIKDSGAKFNTALFFCEDLCYNIELLLKNPSIAYYNKAFYHYYYSQNQSSLTRKYSERVYIHDQRLITYLTGLPLDNSQKRDAFNSMSWIISWRAFVSGYYESDDYSRRFKKYLLPIIRSKANIKIKALLIMANMHLYNLARKLYIKYKN